MEASFTEDESPSKFCDKKYSFGVYRGDRTYQSRSDFGLELLDFVMADSKTGFVCTVLRKSDEQQRYGRVQLIIQQLYSCTVLYIIIYRDH